MLSSTFTLAASHRNATQCFFDASNRQRFDHKNCGNKNKWTNSIMLWGTRYTPKMSLASFVFLANDRIDGCHSSFGGEYVQENWANIYGQHRNICRILMLLYIQYYMRPAINVIITCFFLLFGYVVEVPSMANTRRRITCKRGKYLVKQIEGSWCWTRLLPAISLISNLRGRQENSTYALISPTNASSK